MPSSSAPALKVISFLFPGRTDVSKFKSIYDSFQPYSEKKMLWIFACLHLISVKISKSVKLT